MSRRRLCKLPFCENLIESGRNRNTRYCKDHSNIHLHRQVSEKLKKIMTFIEAGKPFVVRELISAIFKNGLTHDATASLYRALNAMKKMGYLVLMPDENHGKITYIFNTESGMSRQEKTEEHEQ